MSTISSVQGGSTPSPLQPPPVEGSPEDEKTEGPAKKAAEAQAAQTAKRLKKHRRHPGSRRRRSRRSRRRRPTTPRPRLAARPKAVDVRA